MKKTFLTFALLLAVTALSAQTLLKVSLQKGDRATYENVTSIGMTAPMGGGSQSVKVTNRTFVEVKDATPDGYKVEFLTKDTKTEGNTELAYQVGDRLSRFVDNVPLLFQTDVNGGLQKLLNYEEEGCPCRNRFHLQKESRYGEGFAEGKDDHGIERPVL